MLTGKYLLACQTSIGFADEYYKKTGIATVVTDGRYVQLESEEVEDGRKKENCT